jgi:hypothetical protein
VKTRPIPDIDLARITVRSTDEQRLHLRQLKFFRPTHTLNPFRRVLADLVNLQHPLLGTATRTRWEVIQQAIENSKESADGIARNLAVAKALYEFGSQAEISSFAKPANRWSVGYGYSVAYWNSFYSVWEGRGAHVYFDPRLSHPLGEAGRRFAFSMMHQRLRVDDPDYADLDLVIVGFGRAVGNERSVQVHRASGLTLYTYDQLNEMIDITYSLWLEELARREAEARRAAGGGNPMDF